MPVGTPSWDAIVLAGGRGSRLGGADKAALRLDGVTLLDRLLSALSDAGRVVVVGDQPPQFSDRSGPVIVVREDPPFGGPVAATAAGLDALLRRSADRADVESSAGPSPAETVALLAVDMPHAAAALPLLLGALASADDDGADGPDGADGVVAVDPVGRRQPLLALYRTARLRESVARIVRDRGGVEGSSMRSLLAGLTLREVQVPDLAAADVDTPEDAARLGISLPSDDAAAVPELR